MSVDILGPTHHRGHPSVAVALEPNRIVGADAQTIETADTPTVIHMTAQYLHTLRRADILTLHAVYALVRIDLDVEQLEAVCRPKDSAYRAHSVAETAPGEETPDEHAADGHDAGGDPDGRSDSELTPGPGRSRGVEDRGEIAHHVPRFYHIGDHNDTEDQRKDVQDEDPCAERQLCLL